MKVKHPAKFSKPILEAIRNILAKYDIYGKILDPFGGVGYLKKTVSDAICIDIEYEWAKEARGICADSTMLPFPNNTFSAIITSPTYGNRMADHFECKNGGKGRFTYRHSLGKALNNNNTGRMQWGKKYRETHLKIYMDCIRVLRSKSFFLLNVSNHIRNGKEIDVVSWHIRTLQRLGLFLTESIPITTQRVGFGQNRNARVDFEWLIVFTLTDFLVRDNINIPPNKSPSSGGNKSLAHAGFLCDGKE